MREFRLIATLFLLGFFCRSNADAESPFSVSASLDPHATAPTVRVTFEIPPRHLVYAEEFKVDVSGATLIPLEVPSPATIFDKLSGENKRVYDESFESVYRLADVRGSVSLVVSFQGCNESICFFPETRTFRLNLGRLADEGANAAGTKTEVSSNDWKTLLGQFDIAAIESGYLSQDAFLVFLDRAVAGESVDRDALSRFHRLGVLATVLLILLGGLGLNLTPCVLPLIPINLAIIGAGAKASSRGRGFALGGMYGLGMAITYGALGLGVVLTGSKFGALNASPWFNLIIAGVFLLLALAMFDLIQIDLTRFQGSSVARIGKKGHWAAVLVMGSISALLAGACVAPMVIFVLLLAGALYNKGLVLGLLLPFLLGLGMALPWPFAGAGLSFLPKPGRWMTWVKSVFGVMILFFAMYYGYEAYRIFRAATAPTPVSVAAVSSGPDTVLADGLQRAQKEGKPVFIDFWATWCKNCVAMDRTTFRNPEVQKKLGTFIVVKYQAEQPNDPPIRDTLDVFKAVGLPTYVVLVPKRGH